MAGSPPVSLIRLRLLSVAAAAAAAAVVAQLAIYSRDLTISHRFALPVAVGVGRESIERKFR